ncbi:MAG: hypothetical protein WBG33_04655 [Rhodanobacter sp.]|jgi:hypothetical protein
MVPPTILHPPVTLVRVRLSSRPCARGGIVPIRPWEQRRRMFENAFNNMDRVMRNDEGLASELDYAEQTSWLLFLKYLDDIDDMEKEWEDEAALEGRDYTPILASRIAGKPGPRRRRPTARLISTPRSPART